ncbi:MAG: aldehyde dehydrogenase family protein [Fimbriimonadaceae bacterium]|nr:MAG: aldehyde dehydrogenase family protein [Fimbriimonadaceae bacterium]
MHCELLIGGHFFGGPCDQSIGKGVARSPWDASLVGTYAEAGWSEVDAALDAAAEAFLTWRRSPRHERVSMLRRVAALARERSAELVETLTLEVGKPVAWSRGEVARLAMTFDLAADLLTGPAGHVLPVDYDPRGTGVGAVVERFPIGPVLAITPYNWPYNLAAHKIAPALAAGCTVVLKPSSLAALSSLALARLIHEAGCPPGVVNAVVCEPDLAERAALDPRVKVVSFTGSEAVGWRLKELLPRKRVVLELGGDARVLVCQGADLDAVVAKTVAGAFGYAGQVCISVQHVLAEEPVAAELRERLVAATEACATGDPRDESTVCGPLIHAGAADRVQEWVSEAVSGGAGLLAGGRREGHVVWPTLLESVPASSRLACDEVFGPVATFSVFDGFDGMVVAANKASGSIQCGVFTPRLDQARAAFEQLETGAVVVNDVPTLRFDSVPYGGVGRSGWGREGVASAFQEFTEPRAWVVRWD